MKKYAVYAAVTGTKYIGEFEAANEDLALAKAQESNESWVSLCHQCASQCEDAEAHDFVAEEVK